MYTSTECTTETIINHHRYCLVIHGCVDGYSRRIIYVRCCYNNRADTVLNLFTSGIQECGLPSWVRSDRGGENVRVAQFMLEHPLRGAGRGSFITGRSVHNQRIERLWRDVFNQCTVLFNRLFQYMENSELLDVNDKVHLFSPRHVFLPRINRSLESF